MRIHQTLTSSLCFYNPLTSKCRLFTYSLPGSVSCPHCWNKGVQHPLRQSGVKIVQPQSLFKASSLLRGEYSSLWQRRRSYFTFSEYKTYSCFFITALHKCIQKFNANLKITYLLEKIELKLLEGGSNNESVCETSPQVRETPAWESCTEFVWIR